MSAVVKSNNATTASSIYPAGMQAYVDRVLADGGQINDFQETYVAFKALEDAGLTTGTGLVAACGAPHGVKITGGFVTKLYDFFRASMDFLPSANAATATLDMTTGRPLLQMDATLGTGVSRAHFKSGNFTGVAGPIGVVASFVLTGDPLAAGEIDIAQFMDAATTNNQAGIISNPLGDGHSRVEWDSYDPSILNVRAFAAKDIYVARRFYGGLHDASLNALYKDGVCQRAEAYTQNAYYVGKVMNPSVGNPGKQPFFKHRSSFYFNGGSLTQAQMKALTAALGALS